MDFTNLKTDHAEWQNFVHHWREYLEGVGGENFNIQKIAHIPAATRKMHNCFTLEENLWHCALSYDAYSVMPELLKLKLPLLTLCKDNNSSSLQGIIKRQKKGYGYSAATAGRVFSQFLKSQKQLNAKDKNGNNISTHLLIAYHQAKYDGTGDHWETLQHWENLQHFLQAYIQGGGRVDSPNKDGKDTLIQAVEMGYNGILMICLENAENIKAQVDNHGESFVSLLINHMSSFRELVYQRNESADKFSSFSPTLKILADVCQREELSSLFFTRSGKGILPMESLNGVIFDPNFMQDTTQIPLSILREFSLRQNINQQSIIKKPKI